MEEKKYVPNDVFEFTLYLKEKFEYFKRIHVYTKPFPRPWDKDYDKSKELTLEEEENLVQEKYFTKERIDELKRQFVEEFMADENPFDISCTDTDGGYKVTEEQLFKFE